MKVIIIGGGAAGIAAAIAASQNGVDVLLIESESTIGGDLFSGMPLLGAYTSLGKPCANSIMNEIIDAVKALDSDGYIGPVCDWRTVYGLCFDPEILRLAVTLLLKKYRVELLLNSTVTKVNLEAGTVKSLEVAGRNGTRVIDCACVVDASGGGNITAMAGGKVEYGDKNGRFQPVSLVFRMVNVNFFALLKFVKDNPEEVILSENPVLGKSPVEAAKMLYVKGYPYVAIAASGKVLGKAIQTKTVHPCTAAFITPTSVKKQEVCINATRLAKINCNDDFEVSAAFAKMAEQTVNIIRFLKEKIPGFDKAGISAVAHRVGVRETGRIQGEYTLRQEDVVNAVKHSDFVARGCHHVDIHGEGTAQVRIPVKDGLAYDIPYQCLIPKGIKNVIAAGRCLSSDRGANGSARVMGTCISTGQAAGTAASIFLKKNKNDFRDIEPAAIQTKLNLR